LAVKYTNGPASTKLPGSELDPTWIFLSRYRCWPSVIEMVEVAGVRIPPSVVNAVKTTDLWLTEGTPA
jgi:hypothetical protein